MVDTKNFSVLDAAKGRSYPSDKAVVYTDVEALYDYDKLEGVANATSDGDAVNALEGQLEALREKIKASALTFHMRGFAPGVTQAINDEAAAKFGPEADLDSGEPFIWRADKWIAESIIRVTDVDDAVDEHRWSIEDVVALRTWLPETEFAKVRLLAFSLSFQAWQFDRAVTADFS